MPTHHPSTSQASVSLATRRYFVQIWRERRSSIPALFLPGIGTILNTYVPPLIVAALIARYSHSRPSLHQLIFPYLLLFAGLWLLAEAVWRLAFFCLNRTDAYAMRELYIEAVDDLIKKDIGFFHDNFAGSLTKKAIGFGKAFENFMDTLSMNIFANVIPLAFAVVVLWRFTPWLVAALIGLCALVFCFVLPLTRSRRSLVVAREEASNVMAGHVADMIGNMDAVQAFAHEDFEARQHAHNARDYMAKARRAWDYHNNRIDMSISPMFVLINVTGLLLAVEFGKSAASLSVIFITFNYFASATRVLFEFNRIYRNIENSISEAAQFTELLLAPPALQEVKRPADFAVPHGEITFQDVTFGYGAGEKRPLFEHLNLHIRPGEKLALVGHSGGGKSTVTKLLLRFVDVSSGALLIDGQNIAEARLSDLRSAIAYVPQEPAMFHRTIRENIRYGRLDASDADVIAAAKKANAHDFISQLPQGYDTMVGERGVKLSGGQRQRIAIARAIIKDAPILVLDEATSALDSESEKLIQAALWKLMQGRTAVVIAHRLSTIQKMDRIVVLDRGRVVEQGTHAELLAQKGTYATLWAHQSGGFIEE